jgi:thiamine-phosphate pyrophosphorylase
MSAALAGVGFGASANAAPRLLERAGQIRAQLGRWAAAPLAWRIWTQMDAQALGRDDLGAGDVLCVEPGQCVPAAAAVRGAAVVTAAEAGVSLEWGAQVYRLIGAPTPDWLPALAAFLDCGFEPQDALCLAWRWREHADAAHGTPCGWPRSIAELPEVAGLPAQPTAFAPCPARLGLYPVVPDAQWVERLLALGVQTVQLRCKASTPATLEREVRRAVDAGRAHDARVFINDHWQLALQAGAYGVHLGQEDWPDADLPALARAGIRLGLSTHGVYEMRVAWHVRPSYIAMGAVFATATKQVATAPQGLARLRRYVDLLDGQVPSVAIGGIGLAQLPEVLACGVGSAAVVSAVTGAADTAAAVNALQHVFAH